MDPPLAAPQRPRACLNLRGLLRVVIVLSYCGFNIEAVLSAEEAISKLRGVGAELAWPGFENDASLVEFAFSDQRYLPTPAGASGDGGKVVSTNPYVVVFDNFITSREANFLRAFGANRLKPAMVVQSGDNWYDTQTQTRNNEQVWLTQQEERETPLLRHILKRIHRATRVPDEYAEALQIGKYKEGTKYEGHVDSDPANKVGRPATFIVYLNDPEEGGDTLFPLGRSDCNAAWRKDPKTGEDVYGAKLCCQTPEKDAPETVRIRPKLGRAMLFYSHRPDGSIDRSSTHIGCPVAKGEKWIAQRWLRYEPYNKVNYALGAGWDERYDGHPAKHHRAKLPGHNEGRPEVHLRQLSQTRPKAYLEEHFLDDEEVKAIHMEMHKKHGFIFGAMAWAMSHPDQPYGEHLDKSDPKNRMPEEMHFDKAELDNDPILKQATDKVHLYARLPPIENVTLHFRQLFVGAVEPVQIEENPPAVRVYVYITSALDYNDVRGGDFIYPAAHIASGEEALKAVNDCAADFDACCAASRFKVEPHRGDAVLVYHYGQDGRLDPSAFHGHCKVQMGRHWIAEWMFWFKPEGQDQPASERNQVEPQAVFENQGKELVEIFWSPPHGGDEASMGNLAPGETKLLNTHSGHHFNIRKPDGTLVDKFTVGSTGHQRFLITEKQEL
jgi:prolyl 4-hydroxylase